MFASISGQMAVYSIDVINVRKIIINVNKRVYSEKDSKRL